MAAETKQSQISADTFILLAECFTLYKQILLSNVYVPTEEEKKRILTVLCSLYTSIYKNRVWYEKTFSNPECSKELSDYLKSKITSPPLTEDDARSFYAFINSQISSVEIALKIRAGKIQLGGHHFADPLQNPLFQILTLRAISDTFCEHLPKIIGAVSKNLEISINFGSANKVSDESSLEECLEIFFNIHEEVRNAVAKESLIQSVFLATQLKNIRLGDSPWGCLKRLLVAFPPTVKMVIASSGVDPERYVLEEFNIQDFPTDAIGLDSRISTGTQLSLQIGECKFPAQLSQKIQGMLSSAAHLNSSNRGIELRKLIEGGTNNGNFRIHVMPHVSGEWMVDIPDTSLATQEVKARTAERIRPQEPATIQMSRISSVPVPTAPPAAPPSSCSVFSNPVSSSTTSAKASTALSTPATASQEATSTGNTSPPQ